MKWVIRSLKNNKETTRKQQENNNIGTNIAEIKKPARSGLFYK